MFSDETPRKLAEPRPPEPMMPMLSFSFGESLAAPSKRLGAAEPMSPAAPAVLKKVLRFMMVP